ncbi:hypothetical protein [Salegentibacter sp. F14]
MRNSTRDVFLFHLLILFAACNFNENRSAVVAETASEEVRPASPNLVTIRTADFVFLEVPDTIPSGINTFKIENEGAYPHNAAIVRITGDHSYEEMIEFVENNNSRFPEWAVFMGGPSAPLSGETSEATMKLYAGNYAIICGVPVPKGMPHFMRGMTKALTVVEKNNKAPAPQEDIVLVMDDYSFNMDPAITAGTKTIKVENAAEQDHEFILARLEEGKSGGDMLNWLGQVIQTEKGVLPQVPGVFLNGVSPLEKGLVNYISVDFSPGEYVLICPILDKGDGRPHFMHGMIHQFSVDSEK